MPELRGNYNQVLHHIPTTLCVQASQAAIVSPRSDVFYTKLKTSRERLGMKIYFPDQCAKLLGCKTNYILSLANTIKVSCHIFIFISSKQECWQCTCSRCIQQNSLQALVLVKNGSSSICESGRLQALLNQAQQFYTDFHHCISITWWSAPNLVF